MESILSIYGLQTLASALSYLVFHWRFFRSTTSIFGMPRLHWKYLGVTFVLNYTIFFFCSILSLHLIVNWIVFLFLLFGELLFLRRPPQECFLPALMGTQLGLTINILCRSLFAILLDVPLIAFDNNVTLSGNRKIYPILLGFVIAGAVFWLTERLCLLRALPMVCKDRANLIFLCSLLFAMHLYLCLNLLVYNIADGPLILKLWSMKSSIFVLVGESLSVFFAMRMSQLSAYRSENQITRQVLAAEHIREIALQTAATTDPLTGCENRLQGETRLGDACAAHRPFCLCFIDLNGLKTVNDSAGHEMGDRYLLAVSETLQHACKKGDCLFRYGGDEFLILFFDATPAEASRRLEGVQQELCSKSETPAFPFRMSISYGCIPREAGMDAAALIERADTRMYAMKNAMKGNGT